ncbi:MAG TPA: PstS family phosphate ABC transporter substrate-binding protein [Deltaproteobacteria bacterium]|nr:PstS family phosphate ABC transporter substrate-binding protein [Deltaproteobacteria bacterium]
MRLQMFSRRILQSVCAAALFIATSGTSSVAAGPDLTIKGSTTVLPIAQITAEVFMEQNQGINISVQGGGSGVGIASLIDGTTDIADASRKIKDKEIDIAKAAGVDPYENVIAMDGIAVVVHPKNPISSLTREQIKSIYTGNISDWSEVGARSGRIIVISRDSSSGTFETFEELALDKEKVRPDALTTASNQAVAQTVAQTPGAIGYIGLGYLSGKVKDIKVDNVKCTRKDIISGKYCLSRPLFMYTNGAPAGNAKRFIDFVLSDEGQKMVEEEGFVGLN